MSTLQRANLGFPAALGTSAAALVDNAASQVILVTGIWLFNSDTASRTAKVYLVPNSASALGTAGSTNQMGEYVLATKESLFIEIPFGFTMTGTHDSIQASADAASKVYAVCCGDKLA